MEKQCRLCKKYKKETDFQKTRKYYAKVCRKCRSDQGYARRKVKFSDSWFGYRYQRLRANSKIRGIEFNLSVKKYRELKSNEKCNYCKQKTECVTIDRVDNGIGYIDSNCENCCFLCNKIKSAIFTVEEMSFIGEAVARYRKRTNDFS